jgi:hypothetical protein
VNEKRAKRLAARLFPKVKARIEELGPEFTPAMKAALIGAEMMFRIQGGCAPIVRSLTTEDGEFFTPLPDEVTSHEAIVGFLGDLLNAKPGNLSVAVSYTSTPVGGGSADASRTLYCLIMTTMTLNVLSAAVTGKRSLGRWTLTKKRLIPGTHLEESPEYRLGFLVATWEGELAEGMGVKEFLTQLRINGEAVLTKPVAPVEIKAGSILPLVLVAPPKAITVVLDGRVEADRKANHAYLLSNEWVDANQLQQLRDAGQLAGAIAQVNFQGIITADEIGIHVKGQGKDKVCHGVVYLFELSSREWYEVAPAWGSPD